MRGRAIGAYNMLFMAPISQGKKQRPRDPASNNQQRFSMRINVECIPSRAPEERWTGELRRVPENRGTNGRRWWRKYERRWEAKTSMYGLFKEAMEYIGEEQKEGETALRNKVSNDTHLEVTADGGNNKGGPHRKKTPNGPRN